MSSVQLKSPGRTIGVSSIEVQGHHNYNTGVARTSTSASLSTSPVVIRTQTGSLSANPQSLQGSFSNQNFPSSAGQVQHHQVVQNQHHQTLQQHNRYQTIQHHQQQPQPQQQLSHGSQLVSGTPPKSLITTPILDHSGARKRHDFDFDYSVER